MYHKRWDDNFQGQLAFSATKKLYCRIKEAGTWDSWCMIPKYAGNLSGNYTGNGSDTSQTIIACVGTNVILVWNSSYFSIVSPMGALCVQGGTGITSLKSSEARYSNGNLILATTNARLNANGVVHYWYILG